MIQQLMLTTVLSVQSTNTKGFSRRDITQQQIYPIVNERIKLHQYIPTNEKQQMHCDGQSVLPLTFRAFKDLRFRQHKVNNNFCYNKNKALKSDLMNLFNRMCSSE